jgi:formate hydrogenlyase transcriptional activator
VFQKRSKIVPIATSSSKTNPKAHDRIRLEQEAERFSGQPGEERKMRGALAVPVGIGLGGVPEMSGILDPRAMKAGEEGYGFEGMVGASPALAKIKKMIRVVAATDATVLIEGETGTGKELVARAIHKQSPRYGREFVCVNCAATPPGLIASELFGHEKGAFTGALQQRRGRFELAEGGTIFLDEVAELSADAQVALLRVLQEHEFERVGGSSTIRADVRVIAATHRHLPTAVAAKTFREDLFYRLDVFLVRMPSLRERVADIPLLSEYFMKRFSHKMGKKIQGISSETIELLKSYSWPGNIRELQNVIERAVIMAETSTLHVDPSWFLSK